MHDMARKEYVNTLGGGSISLNYVQCMCKSVVKNVFHMQLNHPIWLKHKIK